MKLVDFKVVLDYFVSQSGYHDREICIFLISVWETDFLS